MSSPMDAVESFGYMLLTSRKPGSGISFSEKDTGLSNSSLQAKASSPAGLA
jgi:hypothetical protein